MTDREYIIHSRVISFYSIVRLIHLLRIIDIDRQLDNLSLYELAQAANSVRGSTKQDIKLYNSIERLIYKEIK